MKHGNHVLIAGAGPVGLTARCARRRRHRGHRRREAARAQRRVARVDVPSAHARDPRSARSARRRPRSRPGGGPAAIPHRRRRRLRRVFDGRRSRDETAFPYRLHLEQAQVTPIILERLRRHRMRACCSTPKLQQVAQHGNAVVARVRHGAGSETLDGAFLVAADGSRSDVRARARHPIRRRGISGQDPARHDQRRPGRAAAGHRARDVSVQRGKVGELPADGRLLAHHPARAEGRRRRAGARLPTGSSRACAK